MKLKTFNEHSDNENSLTKTLAESGHYVLHTHISNKYDQCIRKKEKISESEILLVDSVH